jgi:type II secretory pathway pseudopilin PulG
MIETVGVLAIIAILATVIFSATVRHLDFAASNLESTNLVSFANALQTSAMRYRYIPGPIPGPTGSTNWVQMIATELGMNPAMVSTNARNSRRVLLTDPNNTIALPYAQTNTGTGSILPPTARLLILSTLGPPFPASLADGPTGDFNTIWTTPDGTLPAVSASNPLYSWRGKGDDLKVQRLDLSGLFVHLVLWNYVAANHLGLYQIGQLTPSVVPLAGVNSFFLKSTILSLLYDRNSMGGQFVDQVDQILNRDAEFFYIPPVWRGTLDLGLGLGQGTTNITESSMLAGAFAGTIAAFTASPATNSRALSGATPSKVASAITTFMNGYMTYATNQSSYLTAYGGQSAMFRAMTNLAYGLPIPPGP